MNINKQSEGLISNIQHFSVHDGPGIRTTVFFWGCPLRCRWCANPETWVQSDDETLKAKVYTVDTLVEELLQQSIFFRSTGGGVTFSGGEATAQSEYFNEVSKALYERGIHMVLETSGYFDFETNLESISRMDLIYFDIKLLDQKSHIHWCGQSNDLILENLIKLNELKKQIVIRLPLIEPVNMVHDHLGKVLDFLKTNSIHAEISLLPYHDFASKKYQQLGLEFMTELQAPKKEQLEEIKSFFIENGYLCYFDNPPK